MTEEIFKMPYELFMNNKVKFIIALPILLPFFVFLWPWILFLAIAMEGAFMFIDWLTD